MKMSTPRAKVASSAPALEWMWPVSYTHLRRGPEAERVQTLDALLRPVGGVLADACPRHLKDRAHAHAHRAAVKGVAAGRRHQHRVDAERSCRAEDRPHIRVVHDALEPVSYTHLVRTRRHRRYCGSTMETVCATVGPTHRLWNLRSICSAIQRAFTSSRASKRETRGDAARFLASAQAHIIICIPLSSMPISIFGTPGAYSPSSVQGMLPSLSAVTWRTWRKMSALLVSYSS